MTKTRRLRVIALPEQLAYMRLVWPCLNCRVARKLLICSGKLMPLDISDEYTVRVTYRIGDIPVVWVDGLPSTEKEKTGNKIPHRFQNGSICLFCGNDWSADKTIAHTIIPWLLEWLVFYEGWLTTGDWQGGGTHPERWAPEGERPP